jgi:hypothetical protein
MAAHRGGMGGKADPALRLIDGAEGILIGVERHLGVDDQGAAARDADDDVRAQPTVLALDADSVWKSQFSVRPQVSSTFLSCCSPQRPRDFGALRSELTSLAASLLTFSWPTASIR